MIGLCREDRGQVQHGWAEVDEMVQVLSNPVQISPEELARGVRPGVDDLVVPPGRSAQSGSGRWARDDAKRSGNTW